MRGFLAVSILFGLLLSVAGPAFAYDNDVHYCLTYYLARKAGFTQKQAQQVASGAVGVDLSPATEPLQVPITVKSLANHSERRASDIRANFHAFADSFVYDEVEKARLANGDTPENAAARAKELALEARNKRQAALWKQGLDAGNCGVYIHFYQDIFSHGQYYSWLGHPFMGHWPDFLSYDTQGGGTMGWDTLRELSSLMHMLLPREPREPDSNEVWDVLRQFFTINQHTALTNVTNRYSVSDGAGVPDWKLARDLVSRSLGETVPDWIPYNVLESGDVSTEGWQVEGSHLLTAPLRIKVVEDKTGEPITGAKVTLRFAKSEDVLLTATTSDGIWDIATVPGGQDTFVAKALKEGYWPAQVSFQVADTPPYVVALRLKEGKVTTGRWRLDPADPETKAAKDDAGPLTWEESGQQYGEYSWRVSGTTAFAEWKQKADGITVPAKVTAQWQFPSFPDELLPAQEIDVTVSGSANADANMAYSWPQFRATGALDWGPMDQLWVGQIIPNDPNEASRTSFGTTRTLRWTVPDREGAPSGKLYISAEVTTRESNSSALHLTRDVYRRIYRWDDGAKPVPVEPRKAALAPAAYTPDPRYAHLDANARPDGGTPPSTGGAPATGGERPAGYTITETPSGALVSIDGGEGVELKPGQELPRGKTLLFHNNGINNLSVRLPNGATIVLAPTSYFRIDPNGVLTLVSGAVDVITAAGQPKSSVEIRTEDMTVTDEGTVFRVAYDPKSRKTAVGVREGSVKVAPSASGQPPVTLRAGQEVTCAGGAPGPVTESGGGTPGAATSTAEAPAPAGEPLLTAGGTWCGLAFLQDQCLPSARVVMEWPGLEAQASAGPGGTEQVRVTRFLPGGTAAEKLQVGDLLTRVNGEPVTSLKQFFDLVTGVLNKPAPFPIAFELKRGEELHSAGFPPPQ